MQFSILNYVYGPVLMSSIISPARGQRGEEVLNRLRDMAIFYEFKPGERLSESELALRLGVSRTPVREALTVLAHEGFLEASSRGYTRRRLDVKEMKDLYELRLGVERDCCRYAVQRAQPEQIAELEAFLEHSRGVAIDTSASALVELDEGFHARLAGMSGNDELLRLMHRINQRIRFMRWISMNPEAREATQAQHQALLDALKARDAERMDALITDHISLRQDQIVSAVTKGLAHIFL